MQTILLLEDWKSSICIKDCEYLILIQSSILLKKHIGVLHEKEN